MNAEDDTVLRERVFPRLKRGVPDPSGYEVHLANASRVMLKCGELIRSRCPQHDRGIAFDPTCVVGGIAEIRHAIRGQLRLDSRLDITDPEVVLPDERGLAPVRREYGVAVGRIVLTVAPTLVRFEITGDTTIVDGEAHGRHVVGDRHTGGRKRERCDGLADFPGERFGQPGVIERPLPRGPRRVDQHDFATLGNRVHVPHPTVG